jgi:hypothetical protein
MRFVHRRTGPLAYLSRAVSRKVERPSIPAVELPTTHSNSAPIQLLDPTAAVREPFKLAPRSADGELLGAIGMFSINKRGSDELLDRLQALLAIRFPHIPVKRYAKATFSRVADEALVDRVAAEVRHVIAALAD